MISNITDMPRQSARGDRDAFGIEPYENGLANFIKRTSTPITIALQGEWGSGKTSLMNSLQNNLADQQDSEFLSVWLNTWEYSLMQDAQSTLVDIIVKLIKETTHISNVDSSTSKKLIQKAASIGKGLLKVGLKAAGDKVIDGAGEALSEQLFNQGNESTIGEIRSELSAIIDECIKKNNKKGLIFFIDDLDRIDPSTAVNLLELLKNIFTLKNCVFILAIDYDVVIKGLEPKFGKISESNEREFRSFFDKIIQVPFSMPTSSYRIDEFLIENLEKTGYINKEQSTNKELAKEFATICSLTVGTNPRSLKRLLNALSLIGCINLERKSDNTDEEKLENDLDLVVNFALVSIQIAYPTVYKLLHRKPAFDRWNEQDALQMNLPALDEESSDKLDQMEEFDEEWEKVLYRLCQKDHFLKKNAIHISDLFNMLRKRIKDNQEEVEDIIESVISLSAVTTLEAFDKPEVNYHKGIFLKQVRARLLKRLKELMPQEAQFIRKLGKRVQTNAYINISEDEWGRWFRLHSRPLNGQIRLSLSCEIWPCKTQSKSLEQIVQEKGAQDLFDKLQSNYNAFAQDKSIYQMTNFLDGSRTGEGHHILTFKAYISKSKVEDFYTEETIDELAQLIVVWTEQLYKIDELRDELHKP